MISFLFYAYQKENSHEYIEILVSFKSAKSRHDLMLETPTRRLPAPTTAAQPDDAFEWQSVEKEEIK